MIANLKDQPQGSRFPIGRSPREPSTLSSINSRYALIGIILMIALFAFELFNFDTTQFALTDLLGETRFAGLKWATILAIAFCGIDFAGLLRVFTPDSDTNTPTEVWYLMAAWLLGATLNATMTWYAVSLTLVNNHVGNAVLSTEQLLMIVPIFVAFLVWLTRIMFIGALSVAGGRLLDGTLGAHKMSSQTHRVAGRHQSTAVGAASQKTRRPIRHTPRRPKRDDDRQIPPMHHPVPVMSDDDAATIFARVPHLADVDAG